MKNKLCILVLMLLLCGAVCFGTSCESEDGKGGDTTPPTLEEIVHGGATVAAEYDYKIGAPPSDFDSGVEFVQAGKSYDETVVPTYVVEDMNELRQLYSILPNEYAVYSYDVSGNTDFSTYSYDEEFFRSNVIVLTRFYCFTGSSSIRYSAQCQRQGDMFVIELRDNSEPDICYTCDIGWHTMLIPVSRAELDGVTEIQVVKK